MIGKNTAIRLISAGMIACSGIPNAHSAGLQISADQQEPAAVVCRVSCPDERGFPGVPETYDCEDLPVIEKNCTLLVYVETKKTLENAIRILRVLTGMED